MDPIHVDCEFIYLLREREFVARAEPVFKIGRTSSWLSRINGYPKGSEVYLVMPVVDSRWYERELLTIFRERYKQATVNNDGEHPIGAEYFEGNLDEMLYIITTFIHNNYPGRMQRRLVDIHAQEY